MARSPENNPAQNPNQEADNTADLNNESYSETIHNPEARKEGRQKRSAKDYRQIREKESAKAQEEENATAIRNKFIQKGRNAVLRRTYKPILPPSILAGWRKSLYEGVKSRLESERSDLESDLLEKKSEINSRKKSNEMAIRKQQKEVHSIENEIKAYEAEIINNSETQPNDISEEDITCYQELLESAKKLLAEAEYGLETAKIIQEVEAEDLSKEQAILEISYGEGINSYKQREARLAINLFWMTDRRWPSHLKKDKQALASLGGLVLNKERASNKKLPYNYYTAFKSSRSEHTPITTTPPGEAKEEVTKETPKSEAGDKDLTKRQLETQEEKETKDRLKKLLEVKMWDPTTDKVKYYQFVNKVTNEKYDISIDTIKDLINGLKPIDDLAKNALRFYGHDLEKAVYRNEINIAKSIIIDRINEMMNHWKINKPKKEKQNEEVTKETPKSEAGDEDSTEEEPTMTSGERAQQAENENAITRTASRKRTEKLHNDEKAWKTEKAALPYQEGDTIKVRFESGDFKDVLITNIEKKDDEIIVTFSYDKEGSWTRPYSYISRWQEDYKKKNQETEQTQEEAEDEEAWKTEKAALPYQEGDIIKIRVDKDGNLEDILITNIWKEDGEIMAKFSHNKETYQEPYSEIMKCQEGYEKKNQ